MKTWDHFWLRHVPPHALAIIRIALGLFLLVYVSLYLPHVRLLFSNEGLVIPFRTNWPAWLMAPSPPVAYAVFGVLILSCVLLTIGYQMRLSCVAIALIGIYYYNLQLHHFPTSYNRILLFCLFTMFISGADKTFSLRMWRSYGSPFAWEPVSILPLRFIALQITFTFAGVGWQKWILPMWKGGEVLGYSFISRWASPLTWQMNKLPLMLGHYDALLLFVKVFETVLPFSFWIPRLRIAGLIGMTGFLLFVAFFLSIWWFVFLIPAGIAFFPPETVFERCRKLLPGKIPSGPRKPTKIRRSTFLRFCS